MSALVTFGFTPAEIRQSYLDYGAKLKQAEIDALVGRLGIPIMGLAHDPDDYGFAVASARIDRLEDGRFEFAEYEGEPALIVLARDEWNEIADIVALKRNEPLRPWIGAISMLGRQNVTAPRLLGPHLTVHRDGFAWLKDERHGVALIDDARAAIELRDFGPFAAEDIETGLRLRALLTPPSPEIFVPQPIEERRAA